NILARANVIFSEAGAPNTKLYMVDTQIHIERATGMNIGRGTVMLTKATTELSIGAVEAILAHEAIHIKQRDVLINQLARMVFFGGIAAAIYLFFDQLVLLADHLFLFIPVFYLLMMLFPLYL